MKIGILTHHYINNYGAFLQAYALQNAVSDLFPDSTVEIINMINIKHFIINTGGWFRINKYNDNLMTWIDKTKVPRVFGKSRKEYMVLSKLCFSVSQLNKLKYDHIIVGSDEVWNYLDKKSVAPVKFGIGIENSNLIAYAPSVGKSNGDNIPTYVSEGMKLFSCISSRDVLTSNLVEKITGKRPVDVLDPTFLSEFPNANIKRVKKPYILFYYCENMPENIRNQIFSHARKHNFAIYGAGESNKIFSGRTIDLSPFEWVEMFRNASYVFTGTFHGTVFSILNRKPFSVFLTNESRIKKVNALLNHFNIISREIKEGFVFDYDVMANSVDYDEVWKIIEQDKKRSIEFIKESILRGEIDNG